MIIHLVDVLFAIAALLIGVTLCSYGAVFTVVLIDEWGTRHRERSVVREADRVMRRDRVRRSSVPDDSARD